MEVDEEGDVVEDWEMWDVEEEEWEEEDWEEEEWEEEEWDEEEEEEGEEVSSGPLTPSHSHMLTKAGKRKGPPLLLPGPLSPLQKGRRHQLLQKRVVRRSNPLQKGQVRHNPLKKVMVMHQQPLAKGKKSQPLEKGLCQSRQHHHLHLAKGGR